MIGDDNNQNCGAETRGRYWDNERWHRHHHKHHREWHGGPMTGSVWAIGWLFSIGYLHMPFFWRAVLALFIWPYYLGRALIH